MTRQKKEIIRKMDEIYNFIRVDEELGCGFAPAHAYDELYDQIYDLQTKLSHLRHFDSYEDEIDFDMTLQDNMFYDSDDELPFM